MQQGASYTIFLNALTGDRSSHALRAKMGQQPVWHTAAQQTLCCSVSTSGRARTYEQHDSGQEHIHERPSADRVQRFPRP